MEKNMRQPTPLAGLLIIGLLGWGLSSMTGGSPDAAAKPPVDPQIAACKTEWSKCADNAQLVNDSGKWSEVKVGCKMEANRLANYDEPKWPWIYFGTFLKGDDYVKTGVVVAIEDEAKFQNGFGAWKRVEVRCKYDLKPSAFLTSPSTK
jgi:hypothetical protein